MDKAVNFIDKYMNGGNNEKDDEVKVEGVTIPKGFYYVGGTKEEGIVISDNPADENVYSKEKYEDQANIPGDGLVGNQFVWVPVENPADFRTYTSYLDSETKDSIISSCHEPSQERYRYDGEEKEYNLMKQSVEEHEGFYVARYEAGKENVDGADIIVTKKGASVWNYIAWGDSMTSIGTEGAVAKAKGMYADKEKYTVTSTLIYGAQWDAIMAWIDPAYKTTTCDEDSFPRDSTGNGNYSGSLEKCGSSDNYRVKNIYDLAGNVYEWTMEALSTNLRLGRGGGYNSSGSMDPASKRLSSNRYPPYDSYENVGFRVALYL